MLREKHKTPKTRANLKEFLIRWQLPLSLLLLLINSCSSGQLPKWSGEIWAGDSKNAGITRAQANQTIKATDPAFDKYLAISYDDFRSFYATYVLGCKEWKPGLNMMTNAEAYDRFRVVFEELQQEATQAK